MIQLLYWSPSVKHHPRWRISYRNVLYTILSKVLANRLKKLFPQIISEFQYAFVPMHSITYNVWQHMRIFIIWSVKHQVISVRWPLKLILARHMTEWVGSIFASWCWSLVLMQDGLNWLWLWCHQQGFTYLLMENY